MREITGNILTPSGNNSQIIVCHQVNCMGVMGAGLARQIKEKFPNVFKAYRKQCSLYRHNPGGNLGNVLYCDTDIGYTVANIFGQLSYGTRCRQTDYDAVRTALRSIAASFPNSTIRIPYKMGCGLGGGDWNIMLEIIKNTLVAKGVCVEIWKLE